MKWNSVQSEISAADIESLETAFTKLDLNGNGSLCQQEILDMIPHEDLPTLLNDMDNDGDGRIDYGGGRREGGREGGRDKNNS